jgi:hypothetical protein
MRDGLLACRPSTIGWGTGSQQTLVRHREAASRRPGKIWGDASRWDSRGPGFPSPSHPPRPGAYGVVLFLLVGACGPREYQPLPQPPPPVLPFFSSCYDVLAISFDTASTATAVYQASRPGHDCCSGHSRPESRPSALAHGSASSCTGECDPMVKDGADLERTIQCRHACTASIVCIVRPGSERRPCAGLTCGCGGHTGSSHPCFRPCSLTCSYGCWLLCFFLPIMGLVVLGWEAAGHPPGVGQVVRHLHPPPVAGSQPCRQSSCDWKFDWKSRCAAWRRRVWL